MDDVLKRKIYEQESGKMKSLLKQVECVVMDKSYWEEKGRRIWVIMFNNSHVEENGGLA